MSDQPDKPDKSKITLNITIGGEPLEKIGIEIPRTCRHCDKPVKRADTICQSCWMPLDAQPDKD